MVVSLVADVWQVIVENTYKLHTPKICRAWGGGGTREVERHDIPQVPVNLSLRCPDIKMAAELGGRQCIHNEKTGTVY
jgi:hypothetical protein